MECLLSKNLAPVLFAQPGRLTGVPRIEAIFRAHVGDDRAISRPGTSIAVRQNAKTARRLSSRI